MKTKLIIVLSLICAIGFGQTAKVKKVDSSGSDASWAADSANVVHWADTTGEAGGMASYSDLLEVSGVDAATVAGIVHDTVVNYVTQTALVDSAFTVAGDLTDFLTGADTTSLSDRIDAIDVSAYVAKTDLVDSAFVVAGDLTDFITEAEAASQIHDSIANLTVLADDVVSADTIMVKKDGILSVVPLETDKIELKTDTIPIFPFALGRGLAADTSSFENNALAGWWFNEGSDTIHITSVRGILIEGSGTETIAVQVSWHATFKSGSATNLNSSALTITSITTGDVDTSFANSVIPPGVWVWCTISGVSEGNKPSGFALQLSGYRVPTY